MMVRHASDLREIGLDRSHSNGAADDLAVLIAPGDVADFAKEQLRLYELRQYPVLGGATHFYETSTIDPSIPETVFTTTIAFLLSRETKVGSKKTKPTPTPNNAWTKRMEKQKKKTVTVSPTRKMRCSRHKSMLWRKKQRLAPAVSQ
jgi:hypothetical protein